MTAVKLFFLLFTLVFIILGAGSSLSLANVAIKYKVYQKGYFFENSDGQCVEDSLKIPKVDLCGCEADIVYPVFSGLRNLNAQNKLNDLFAIDAKKQGCDGIQYNQPKELKGWHVTEKQRKFKQVFSSGNYVSLLQEAWEYGAGAAHGANWVVGTIVDIKSGYILTIPKIFGENGTLYGELNQYLEDKLNETDGTYYHEYKQNGQSFPLSNKKLVTPDKCDGCSIYVSENGNLMISFKPYTVASGAVGVVDVEIPKKFVINKELSDILRE